MSTLEGVADSLALDQPTALAATRSTLVSVLAWLLIVCSALGLFIMAAEAVMVYFAMPQLLGINGRGPSPEEIGLIRLFASSALGFVAALALVTLIAAVALLKRRNWGRLYCIGMLILNTLLSFAMLAVQFYFVGSDFMAPLPTALPPEEARIMLTMQKGMLAVITVSTLAFAGLYLWLTKRLLSPAIRAEFVVVR